MTSLQSIARKTMLVQGTVQGVGFRPLLVRLATELELVGWVRNTNQGVEVEAEGEEGRLATFMTRIASLATLNRVLDTEPSGDSGFQIRPSVSTNGNGAYIQPDTATCNACLKELFDPSDRRYRYPFTTCSECGPRFSIQYRTPFDRVNTSMHDFPMCPTCLKEYEDPNDRRFHAETMACPTCGPRVEGWSGEERLTHEEAIQKAVDCISRGRVVAVKGLGGIHLMVDARSDQAVDLLRRRKHRDIKPFALMFSSLNELKTYAECSALEASWLTSPKSPIVLLRKKPGDLSSRIAPGNNPYLGAMLPYTPLHHLLLHDLSFPLVATSGNLSDEPLCYDETECVEQLGHIADFFLMHNRKILRPVDDSVVRSMAGDMQMMRRARGFVPEPIRVSVDCGEIFATGGQLKNTTAVTRGREVFMSAHLGRLDSERAMHLYGKNHDDLCRLFQVKPDRIMKDKHPDYASSQWADEWADGFSIPVEKVQHHHAHILSVMAESGIRGPVLGVAWDGSGLGDDETIWGGEFLICEEAEYHRAASFRSFGLPGGEKAILEPARTALGVLHEMKQTHRLDALTDREKKFMCIAIEKGINAPRTTSAGRLFDACASIIGLRHRVDFEGQAAMEIEFETKQINCEESYVIDLVPRERFIMLDWEPMMRALLSDRDNGMSTSMMAAKIHQAFVHVMVQVALEIGLTNVLLSGGCFQNRILLENAIQSLRKAGFDPGWNRLSPTHDGGLSLGQAFYGGVSSCV